MHSTGSMNKTAFTQKTKMKRPFDIWQLWIQRKKLEIRRKPTGVSPLDLRWNKIYFVNIDWMTKRTESQLAEFWNFLTDFAEKVES